MDNITPAVSVIIPVFNAGKYIERCCHSLFGQTLANMEFVFVDDCSTDNSIEIVKNVLQQYPARQNSVKILTHTPNRGVSFSRQQGLDAATGEYVIHCDSDDWVDIEAYEKIYNEAVHNNADVVRFGNVVEYANNNKKILGYPKQEDFGNLSFNISPMTGSVWGGLIRHRILLENDIRFPDGLNWGEDFYVSICSLLTSKKTVCMHYAPYHYWQNDTSITHTISRKRCLELVEIASQVEAFLIKIGKLDGYAFQLNYLKFQCKASFLRDTSNRDIRFWRTIYPECHKDIMKYPQTLYIRIVAVFCAAHFTLLPTLMLDARECYFKRKLR